ncbi:MTAP family purine nucleoside phosphorylase [Deinococcus sp. QL22]|uniref:MTAP family purine nucleoside phosphorylase n=1 Tax=Deinococcus sp. QL22 TaxID=2939437 RepID=UPI0020170194|nr:MTAP family purine nucleoside phosphorylase [Deinococcus sp. QL22]UQN07947.1 MTAP family purine nucleoside phosphorylase [Deinococcus sp. QL22]
MSKIAIIGSTGLTSGDFLESEEPWKVKTADGLVTGVRGDIGNHQLFFLSRSNGRSGIPAHRVNYRANLLALKELGVEYILATAMVGSLSTFIPVGTFVVLDQFLDFSKLHRTLFGSEGFAFVDMTDPYTPELREAFISALTEGGYPHRSTGTYVMVDGPRFETRAEIEMFRRLGGDVIGMTGVSEAIMAREAGISYGSLAVVVNMGAGLNPKPVTREECYNETVRLSDITKHVIKRVVLNFDHVKPNSAKDAPSDYILADPLDVLV